MSEQNPELDPRAETAPEAATEAAPLQAADAASEADPLQAPEPVAETAAEPVAEPVAETAAEPVTETAPEPVAETAAEPVAETAAEPVAETATEPVEVLSEEEKAAIAAKKEEERKHKEEERKKRDEAYAILEGYKAAGTAFDVSIAERVKGGLRGEFNGLRIFLPASHFGVRKNVPEEELNGLIGQTVRVKVHELQSDDTGYKSAVVTRRDILLEDFWSAIQPGAVYDGIVSSVTAFGAFVNIGGVEGLVHVSRLSKTRVENPADVVKKGDKLKVTVAEVDREKRKLSLSHKEHEDDPWKGVGDTYPTGKRVKGTVRRITDFGAYVQVAPKIEGLLRISELSWTRRVKHPSEVVNVGQEIEIEILSANEEKHQLALGYKQTLENPWLSLTTTMPIGTETSGVVQQISTQGAVVRVNDAFDGFMPRSKIINVGRGAKAPLNVGDSVSCVIVDLNVENASLILAMKGEDGTIGGTQQEEGRYGGGDRQDRGDRGDRGDRRDRGDRGDRGHRGESVAIPQQPGVTLGDMLKDAQKSALQK
ncbi:MAG TPA: S1 RNA-binding domain-containing protein [Candidatus Didemnitutus sp.]|nr:S1 RNA-binding domain-containing protein [Candidatus Didemnitutus sp.]